MSETTTFPEQFNMAHYFLDARVEEGLGDKVAVKCGDAQMTYAEVQARSNQVANALRWLGTEIENRVLIILPDCMEFPPSFFGILKAGAVFAMVNPILKAEDYEYYLDYTRAKVAIVHDSVLPAIEGPAREARYLKNLLVVGDGGGNWPTWEDTVLNASDHFENEPTSRDDVAGWLFTSGTTGKPKAAVHCHHDFPYNTENYCKKVLQLSEDVVTVGVPKLFFGYATGTNLMFPFAVGGTTCLFPERSTPDALFDAIERFKPTFLTTVPTMMNKMLEHERCDGADFSSLTMGVSAGEALPAEIYTRWIDRTGVEILDGIGSAELFHIYITNYPGDVKIGCLGKLVPGYDAKVVGPDDEELPNGEPGRLWIKGDSAGLFYFNRHESSKETLRGDWVVSGDLFRRDDDGYFYYEGRADDMLKVGGVWVSPLEVENCMMKHDAILEVAVVGHEVDGLVKSKACVVLKDGVEGSDDLAKELQDFVKSEIAPYKYPRIVEFHESLPRNDRGKIERRKLVTTL
jgi:benzoate-CoA ligase